MTEKQKIKKDVYEIITSRIIDLLEKGVVPWRKTWVETGFPQNLITKRPYRGLNVWLLLSLGHYQNYFLTLKQLKGVGGSLKENQKPCPVIYWAWKEPEPQDPPETKRRPSLRYYQVYNIEQCEGIPDSLLPDYKEFVRNNNPIDTCSLLIENMPDRPEVKHKENYAFYHPLFDYINMPRMKNFESSEEYYLTLFHEFIHSTGHKTRLNRKEVVQQASFGSELYSIEELIAEIGACYLASFADLPLNDLSNNVAYIQGWLERLKNDKRFIIYASGQAQKAVDYILNVKTPDEEMISENPEV